MAWIIWIFAALSLLSASAINAIVFGVVAISVIWQDREHPDVKGRFCVRDPELWDRDLDKVVARLEEEFPWIYFAIWIMCL